MKILFVPDIHLLPKLPRHRTSDYLEKSLVIIDRLIETIKANNIECVIFTGDIFDRSFENIKLTYLNNIISKFIQISTLVNGNAFTLLGNHEQTYTQSNPYFLITDISNSTIAKELLQNKTTPTLISPCLKVVDKLEINNINIHFFHYNKQNKNYIADILPNTGNIGVYHDDLVSFESKKELYHHRVGDGISVYNTNIFNGIDLAILGHIHTPLSPFGVGNTMVLCPGCLIPRTISESHTNVKLPIVEINDNVNVSEIVFDISDLKETITEETVIAQKEAYENSKIFKMVKKEAKEKDYNDMLSQLPTNIVNIINLADNKLNIDDLIGGNI